MALRPFAPIISPAAASGVSTGLVTPRLRTVVARVGGHATLFRAASDVVAVPRFDALKPPLDRIHAQLKREFDPAGVFNPGRLGF